jgi:hypothetical protein
MPAVAKLCTVCGQDVASKKRVKDPEGRYYCEPCFQTRRAAAGAAKGQPASVPLTNAAPKPTADPAPAADDGLLDLAPEIKPKTDEPMFGCAGCKKVVPQRQVRNIDGEFLCSSCVAKRNAPQRPAARTSTKAAAEEGDENVERWWHTLSGGLMVSAGVVVLTFVLMTALDYFTPEKGHQASLAGSLLMGVLQTVFVVFRAGGLILSMFVAARILGGISFGYIGPVLFKSLGLCAGLTIADYFIDRNESLFMLGFGFRWVAFLVALIVLFGIDAFEAMLLSVVNTALSWILFIGLGILVAIAGLRGGSSDDEEGFNMRDQPPAHVQPADPGQGAAQPADDKDEN